MCADCGRNIVAAMAADEARADVVALIVARRERYRTAARSAERRAQGPRCRWVPSLEDRAWFLASAYDAQADALSALLRDMGVTE